MLRILIIFLSFFQSKTCNWWYILCHGENMYTSWLWDVNTWVRYSAKKIAFLSLLDHITAGSVGLDMVDVYVVHLIDFLIELSNLLKLVTYSLNSTIMKIEQYLMQWINRIIKIDQYFLSTFNEALQCFKQLLNCMYKYPKSNKYAGKH